MEIAIADEQQQHRQSLLHTWQQHIEEEEEEEEEEDTVPILASYQPDKSKSKRLVSLDVFRGLTVALMILVDDAGGAFPAINHSPWFGVTLADFVMPFFLFIVGVSISLVFKKTTDKTAATKKVAMRSINLFLLGLLLQGGYFHGRNNLTYGVDIQKIRWFGVLQRISIGYFLVSLLEIWLVKNVTVDSLAAFAKKYCFQWVVAILLCSVYLALLYGLYVPDWTFETPGINQSVFGSESQISSTVKCGVRGSLEPSCNAVGFIDRVILGEHHLYQHPIYKRTKECSVNSPDYGPLPSDSPEWCLAPFDPEGMISSLMAAISCFLGLHFGHVVVHFEGSMQRIVFWSMSSFSLLISGYTMKILGASGLLLTIIYYMVDVKHIKKPTTLLQWVGMNALIVYALAACDVFPAALQGFFWRSPENNLVNGTEQLLQIMVNSKRWGTLLFVMLQILFWCLVAGFLHLKRIYVKV
ncbi:hypothetical protein ACFE04_018412 [Oxalis oulophora]